jgi:hypothetical protein
MTLGGIMAEEKKRTEIWLKDEQFRILSDMARCQGRTVSEVACDLIAAHLHQFEARIQAQRLEASERVRGHREHILDPSR